MKQGSDNFRDYLNTIIIIRVVFISFGIFCFFMGVTFGFVIWGIS